MLQLFILSLGAKDAVALRVRDVVISDPPSSPERALQASALRYLKLIYQTQNSNTSLTYRVVFKTEGGN